MATDEKANQRSEQLTNEFRALERSDIQIRNDIKHNLSKIHKCNEAINEIQVKRTKLLEENAANEKMLPQKEKELTDLTALKAQVEQEFEKEE